MSRQEAQAAQAIASPAPAGQDLLCAAVLPAEGPPSGERTFAFPLYWLSLRFPRPSEAGGAAMAPESVEQLKDDLRAILCDPLCESVWFAWGNDRGSWLESWESLGYRYFGERQFLPGVTDNLARTVEEALHLKGYRGSVFVASGAGFLFGPGASEAQIESGGQYIIFHPLTDRFKVHDIHAIYNRYFKFPEVHLPEYSAPETVSLDLGDEQLENLSRDRLLALSLAEMKAVKQHYESDPVRQQRRRAGLPEWPTDVELEVIAQTWSEHCKHKIFSAQITYRGEGVAGAPGGRLEIDGLFKTFIQSPTFSLAGERRDLISVFEDNSGIVKWNDEWAVCFKVETHNSPSALEPYGGALTGILGVNRDVLGTGLGARPVFNTDVLCFAYPSGDLPRRPKLLPPEIIIRGVRCGIQDGGNKSGIPTVNGAVCFHPGYRAKPLVFCGTGGILPLEVAGRDACRKHTRPGDTIVVAGGRVGKDGIHGATFSSEALHEGSPVSAVQIGDPFTQKRLLDLILEARDRGLITGITDCGAGGLSSSVGEMAQITGGAHLRLEDIPLKYPGLTDYEIVISESQERMTVSTDRPDELIELANKLGVEATRIGQFTTEGFFRISRGDATVGLLDLHFLHKGAPRMHLEAEWTAPPMAEASLPERTDLALLLLALLAHENVCSREVVIRQYDHEVQGKSVIKPLMGPAQVAPCDAAVIRPLLGGREGLVISNGLCPRLSEYDPYLMAQCAVDEAIRNAVCVGADPSSITLLDNFCWTDPVHSAKNPEGRFKLGQLVRTCQGLADAVLAFGAPLISGKDSMKNDFDDGTIRLSIPPTLLVSAMGRMSDSEAAVSMEFKCPGDIIYVLSAGSLGLAGSLVAEISQWTTGNLPTLDPLAAAHMYQHVHEAILSGEVSSCHDVSDGGLGVALAECSLGSGLGARLLTHRISDAARQCLDAPGTIEEQLLTRLDFALFAEGPARLVVTVPASCQAAFTARMEQFSCIEIGRVVEEPSLSFVNASNENVFAVPVADLLSAWQQMLPFEEDEQ